MSCTLIKNDCLHELKKLDNDIASLIFADPPFNVKKDYTSYIDKRSMDEYEEWSRQWIFELVRVLKPGGSLFLHNIPKWLVGYCSFLNTFPNMDFKHWIAWDALAAPQGESIQPAHYGIVYYVKKPGKFTFHELRMPFKKCRICKTIVARYDGENVMIPPHGPLITDVWKDIHRLKHKEYRTNHPCQLPIHLLERIFLMASEPNDLILDPFVGTGSSAIAATRLGRNFLGFDIDEGYIQTSKDRVDKQIEKSFFNGIYPSCHLREMITVRRDDIYDLREKRYKQEWKDLFKFWTDSNEEKVRMNDKPPKLKKEYTKLMDILNMQLRS